MDLKVFKPTSETVEVTLYNPTTEVPLTNKDNSEMTITMYAPHTKEYKSEVHRQTNMRLKRMEKGAKISLTAEDLEESTLIHMARSTKAWNITYDKEQPDFSVEKAKEVYADISWIKDQIEEALSNSVDFTNV
tara:strand:- start:2394 stop:2792 length:399 start_codon:yes stop_codon:yes gene_type:complete